MHHTTNLDGLPTADQLVADYLRHRRHDWPSARTRELRAGQLRKITEAFPDLLAVTSEDLIDWRDRLPGGPQNHATNVSAARGLFHWLAHVRRARPDDPAATLHRPRIPEAIPRPMPDHHVSLALACALGDPEMYLWIGLMTILGMRCCEIAWLRTTDVEEQPDGRGVARFIGKGRKHRVMPVPCHLMATIKPFLIGGGTVFTRPSDGKAYRPQNISQRVNKFLHDIGIPETAHQLRHRFGTDYHALDPDLLRQARLMGHSSVLTTQRYTEVSPMEAAEHIERLARRRLRRQTGRSGSGADAA